MSKILYYDNASTTQPRYYRTEWHNTSALYQEGVDANNLLYENKEWLKEYFNTNSDGEVIITSGATEANNLIIRSVIEGHYYDFFAYGDTPVIITSPIEHPSVRETLIHFETLGMIEIKYVDIDKGGRVILSSLREILRANKIVILCTIMFVNNEVGTVQPVKDIGNICKEYNVPFHSDVTQACGKIKINMDDYKMDYISFSGHKFHGPKGIGTLMCADRRATSRIHPMIFGGHQQDNLRSGTIPIDLFSMMIEALKAETDRIEEVIDLTISANSKLRKMFALYGSDIDYIEHIADLYIPIYSISFKDCSGDYILQELDKRGYKVSKGSACHTGELTPSYVLQAIGCPDDYIDNTIRISFDVFSKNEETSDYNLRCLVQTICDIVKS